MYYKKNKKITSYFLYSIKLPFLRNLIVVGGEKMENNTRKNSSNTKRNTRSKCNSETRKSTRSNSTSKSNSRSNKTSR